VHIPARVGAVVVHGRAQSPAYVQEHLVSRIGLDDVAFVLPAAPDGSWYPGRYYDSMEVNEPWLGRALASLDDAIAQLGEAGLGSDVIVLAGFSQGACLICEHVLRRPARYRGVALLTGCLIGPRDEPRTLPDLTGLPVYLGTREDDEWIPATDVRAAAHALTRAGATVSLDVRAPGAHQIDDEDVIAVRALLE
jgi:phospholipase/carboxylesterase